VAVCCRRRATDATCKMSEVTVSAAGWAPVKDEASVPGGTRSGRVRAMSARASSGLRIAGLGEKACAHADCHNL